MKRVFIDGSAGTTGLRIRERLEAREDITLITLPEEVRKDPAARKEALNSCDAAFLCLPDAAAKEAAAMVENPNVVVLDASTAHRTNPDWAYGFAELSAAHRNAIATGKRIYRSGISDGGKRYSAQGCSAFLPFHDGLQRRRKNHDRRLRGG